MSILLYAGVSPRLIKYHANYFITTDDVHICSWHCHIWYHTWHKITYLFTRISCNICQVTKYLDSAKRMMKYDPEKIVAHGCKLHMYVSSPFIYNLTYITCITYK